MLAGWEAEKRGFWSSGSEEWRTLRNLSGTPEGDDLASLQNFKQLSRWLRVGFCSRNLVLIGCKSNSQQWTWQKWQRRDERLPGLSKDAWKEGLWVFRSHEFCYLNSTQINIRKEELAMLASCWRFCLLSLLAPVRARSRRAVQSSLLEKLTGFSPQQLEHCANLVVQWETASPASQEGEEQADIYISLLMAL